MSKFYYLYDNIMKSKPKFLRS